MDLQFTADPVEFLAGAREHLAADPVLNTVVATVAERAVREARPVVEDDWFLTVREAGTVVGVGMRTAPFAPRPAFVLPMPDAAARLAAHAVHERGEVLRDVNGALPAARVWLEETARLTGGTVRVGQHTRLFEAAEVRPGRPVPGRLRSARADEVDLVLTWFVAFLGDADEQAGRERGSHHEGHVERDDLLGRIEAGRVWLWEHDGEVVHLTGVNSPAFGAARVGPVYTPPPQRGRGWAGAAVAEVSRRILDAGARPCLFTDQANPTSNALYQALGYTAVVDMANLTLA